jgi:hypothetical protein
MDTNKPDKIKLHEIDSLFQQAQAFDGGRYRFLVLSSGPSCAVPIDKAMSLDVVDRVTMDDKLARVAWVVVDTLASFTDRLGDAMEGRAINLDKVLYSLQNRASTDRLSVVAFGYSQAIIGPALENTRYFTQRLEEADAQEVDAVIAEQARHNILIAIRYTKTLINEARELGEDSQEGDEGYE